MGTALHIAPGFAEGKINSPLNRTGNLSAQQDPLNKGYFYKRIREADYRQEWDMPKAPA